jgi:hypothetical protein
VLPRWALAITFRGYIPPLPLFIRAEREEYNNIIHPQFSLAYGLKIDISLLKQHANKTKKSRRDRVPTHTPNFEETTAWAITPAQQASTGVKKGTRALGLCRMSDAMLVYNTFNKLKLCPQNH